MYFAHIKYFRIVVSRICFKVLVGKHGGQKPLVRPKCRYENNIEINLEIGCEGVDWIHLAQDRVQWQGSSEHGNELQVP
jgi:hypothetical protein